MIRILPVGEIVKNVVYTWSKSVYQPNCLENGFLYHGMSWLFFSFFFLRERLGKKKKTRENKKRFEISPH